MTYLAPRVSIQNVPVCTFKTSLCVPAPHPHVFTHVDVLSVLTDRFERAHEGFPACVTSHTTPHHTAHTHTHHNHNNNHSHTQQRQRQRHTSNLQLHSTQHGKTHQVQTQQGLTDSSFFVFSGGAWPFSQLVKSFVWLLL